MKMISHGNYAGEKHSVQTQDGYIITLHRIPQQNPKQNNQKIILMMHGASEWKAVGS